MATRSSNFLDRLSFSRGTSPILPMHNKNGRRSTDYDLRDLSPRAEAALLHTSPSPEPWVEAPSSVGSDSKRKGSRVMFAGPPPPIAASVVLMQGANKRQPSQERNTENVVGESMAASRPSFGSIFFDRDINDRASYHKPDSAWRSLQRREQAIERDLQQLLDMQASGLIAGGEPPRSGSTSAGGSDRDTYSDTGSSTPTGTFYSTATSKSRMMASLDAPVRATPAGDVIPIRQPKTSRPQGLRAARNGLRRAMSALADLKSEEDAHVALEISQRKKALAHLRNLSARQARITGELKALAEDDEEPLARELSDLGTQHDALSQEIREMEEKLVGMRNRRRWLESKMDDVRNRREAGLSGYRGALKEVDAEVASLMRRPPIRPLDFEVLNEPQTNEPNALRSIQSSPGGAEFLKLIPQRRTMEMAREWWEGEVAILERRKAGVDKAREALKQGAELWQETIKCVTGFESELRKFMKGEISTKGKDKAPTQEDAIRTQLSRMGNVISELEDHLRTAETKRWNLLICAISAELEAFKEAEAMLRESLLEDEDDAWNAPPTPTRPGQNPNGKHLVNMDQDQGPLQDDRADESDNEVPPDLLVSHLDEHDEALSALQPDSPASLRKSDSDNDVPPEFLSEHQPGDEEVD